MTVTMYDEDELLPISGLQHYLFCRRRAALIFVEGLWDENIFTAEGSVIHEKVHSALYEWRRGVRITRGLPLRSLRLGLIGKADVVEVRPGSLSATETVDISLTETRAEHLRQKETGPEFIPIEYKRGRIRHEESYKVQLCAQALCLEEMLQIRVAKGAIFYSESGRKMEVIFDEALRHLTCEVAAGFHLLVQGGETPIVPYSKKCDKCSLLTLCMPKVTGAKRRMTRYLEMHTMLREDNT